MRRSSKNTSTFKGEQPEEQSRARQKKDPREHEKGSAISKKGMQHQ